MIAWTVLSSLGHASEPSELGEGESHEEARVIAGLRAIGGMTSGPEHAASLGGGGLAVEGAIGHHTFIEGAAATVLGPEGPELPFELVAERAFTVGRSLEPYVGLGPALLVHLAEHATAGWGGVAVVGTHWWMGNFGLQLELDATASHQAEWAFGGEVVTGVGWRWQ